MTTPLITTLTEYEEKALDLVADLQKEILGYVKQVVDVVDDRLPELELPELAVLDQIPTLSEVVDSQFAFSKKVLSNQEKFAKNLVKTIKPLTRDAQKPATKPATKSTTKTATKTTRTAA